MKNSNSGWPNWGDHPLVVFVTLSAGLIAIFVFVSGIPTLPAIVGIDSTATPYSKTISTAIIDTPTVKPPTPEPTTSATGNILFIEDFATADMTGKRNVDVVGPWKIENGKYLIDLSGPNLPWAATFIYPPSRDIREWMDYSVEADLMCEESDSGFYAGVGVRQGGENTVGFELHWIANYVALARTTETQEYHILRSEEFGLGFRQLYHLKLVVSGNRIWAYVDDRLAIDYTDTSETQQYYGGVSLTVYGGGKIGCSFDNVRVVAVNP